MEKELLRFAQLNNLLWEQIKDVRQVVADLKALAAVPSAHAPEGISSPEGPSEEEARAAQELTEKITKRMAARTEAAEARRKALEERLNQGELTEEEQEEWLSMWKFH